jgi:CheY-like chemotaxis protein
MSLQRNYISYTGAIAMMLLFSTSATAQQAGAKKPAPPKPAPKAASADAAAAPGAAPAADANAKPEDLRVKIEVEKNPAVLTALEMPRKTPADHLQVVLWLIDLDRQQLAKPILEELGKLQLTDSQRAELVNQFGSGSMLKLAQAKDLAPAGAAFAQACTAAAEAATNNPQRLETLIKQLADPSPEIRIAAQHDLAASGQKAVNATLEALAREADPKRRDALATGIMAMHPLSDGPLLAMLDTRDPALRAYIADMLQQLNVPQAAPFLAANEPAAERQLISALSSYSRGTPVFAADPSNQVELWVWDDAAKKLSSVRSTANDARIYWMAKLARALYHLRPQNPDYQLRALVLAWESGSSAKTQLTDTRLLNDVLREALKQNHPHAALAAVNALGQSRNPSVLITTDGKPSPLADAVTSPDRGVRFAALHAIMTLDPTSPFPGSSRIPEALAWFAESAAQRRAVVAMPTNEMASQLAGQLSAHGLDAEATNRGREAVTMARDLPEVDAIFVDMDILLPSIRQVLFELRRNPTSGDVPIALLAADGRFEAAQKLAAEHQRVIAVPRLHTAEAVANTVNELARLATPDAAPANERTAQAALAKAWLAKLESGARPFYVVRRTALLEPAPPQRVLPANVPHQ